MKTKNIGMIALIGVAAWFLLKGKPAAAATTEKVTAEDLIAQGWTPEALTYSYPELVGIPPVVPATPQAVEEAIESVDGTFVQSVAAASLSVGSSTTTNTILEYEIYRALHPELPKPSSLGEWTGFHPTEATIQQLKDKYGAL